MDQSDKNCLPYKYDAFCKTEIAKSDKYTFVWKISDFCSRSEKNCEVLNSEDFFIKGPDEEITKWCAEIFPKGDGSDNNEYISVYLKKKTIEEVHVFYTLYYLNANKIEHKLDVLSDEGKSKLELKRGQSLGFPKAIRRKDLPRYLHDGDLTLFFEIVIIGKSKKSIEFLNHEERCLALTDNYHQKQLANDYEMLFLSKDSSDVIIRCGEKVFNCHKIVLASRSPVFKTMLESNMREKITGDIEIKNMDHEVLEDLLKYIYSGGAPNIDAHTKELFAAADLYQLEKLKELCEMKLCSRFDVSNCIDLLILGDLYNAQKLKAAGLEFVSKNLHKMKTSEWKESFIVHPALMAEVVERMMPKNDDVNDSAEVKKRAAS